MTTASPTISKSSVATLIDELVAATPAFLFGLRMWASVCLAFYVAFALELSEPSWAATTAAIVCQPVLGASLRKAPFRLIGTVVGAIAIVILAATLNAVPSIPAIVLVLVLSVDWFIGMVRALGNLIGNCVATVVVAAWERELDLPLAEHVLDRDVVVEARAA